jgi:hypothetical protein
VLDKDRVMIKPPRLGNTPRRLGYSVTSSLHETQDQGVNAGRNHAPMRLATMRIALPSIDPLHY